MGTIRCGLILAACLTLAGTSMAQDANPVPGAPGVPAPAPAVDTNAVPIPAPVDPTLAQPLTPAPDAAASAAAPVKAPAKPKKVAPAIPTVRGAAGKLDLVAMVLPVDVKGKQETFKVSSKTRVFADGKPAILSDAKEGENVVVEYRTAKDKSKEALTLRFGGAAASTVQKSAAPAKKPVAKKPKKAKKAAAPKPVDAAAPVPMAPAPVETIPPSTPAPVPPGGVTPLPPGTTPTPQ